MKSTTLVLGFLCLLIMGASDSFAQSAESFHKRFQIIRSDDGKLVGVRDRTLPVKFQVRPYIEMVKSHILNEQSLLSEKNLASGEYDDNVRALFAEDEAAFVASGGTNPQFERNLDNVIASLKKLAVLNVDEIFTNQGFNEVIGAVENKMTDSILLLDPTMIAQVNDPTFFYKRNTTYQVVTWGLNFAKKRLSTVPMLNTASYIIVEVERLITERRNFHQNMLLHYLENFKEDELGLTADEVNRIWSSVYESRIPWYAFWESSSAKANWPKYGINNFYYNFRLASSKLQKSNALYSEVGTRVNFAFNEVVYNNERVMVNLFDNESMFQRRPAVAYNFDRPTQVVRKRIMLNLAKLGLSFVPLNSMVKDTANNFIKSFFVNQKVTEGALYGYFESNEDQKAMRQIKAQYMNPFDTLAM